MDSAVSSGKSKPVREYNQALGFNVGLPTSAGFSRIAQDTGEFQSFYFKKGQKGVIDDNTGLPVSGATQLTIQTRGGMKYEVGDYEVIWAGSATVDGQPSPVGLTVPAVSTSNVHYNIQGEMTSFSIVPLGGVTDTYTSTFRKRAERGLCLRWMEAWRTNEDGGTGGAEYDSTHPYVRIRSGQGPNTFYHRLPTGTFIGDTCRDLKKAPWITFHHRATNQNITDAIAEIRATGCTETIYVEYSNEAWNSAFPQWTYFRDNADSSGNYPGAPGDTALVAAYHADRTDQIGSVVKAADSNCVIVWGVFTAVPNTFTNAMDYGMYAPFPNIDVFSPSWYFGGPPARALTESEAQNLTAAEAETLCRDDWTTRVVPLIQQWKAHADGVGKYLAAYEGGPHLDRSPADNGSQNLSDLSQTPEVGKVVGEAMDWWHVNIGQLACFFQDVGNSADPWSWLWGELGVDSDRLSQFYSRAGKTV